MTNGFGVSGAVLVGLLLALIAFMFSRYRIQGAIVRGPFTWRSFWGEEMGAVSVLYFIRGGPVIINGSATPPTAIQASQVQKQTAQVIFTADSDVQALFTHNWGLDTSAPTYFEPEILYWTQLTNAGGTYVAGLTFDVTNTNVVKVNKLNFLGTGGTFIVTLRRPQSIGQ